MTARTQPPLPPLSQPNAVAPSASPSARKSFRSRLFRHTRPVGLILVLGLALASTSCGDSARQAAAAEALKAQQTKLAQRETALAELEKKEAAANAEQKKSLDDAQQVLEKAQQEVSQERQALATERQSLEKLKTEIEAQRKEAEAITAKLKQEQEAAAARAKAAALAARRGSIPSVSADRVYVFDPKTDEVLYEKNADKRAPVASTQKLLTCLIVVEAGNLDATVTIQPEDINCGNVRSGFKVGETYTRRQLLTALLMCSYNDLAQALARDNAGSIEAFAAKMNQRAAQLGMTNSHFMNPHGLPIDDQYSTARDMAKVAKQDDTMQDIRQIVCNKELLFTKADGKTRKLENTNHVLRSDPHCDGMKTGYTELSGHCLICSGEKDGVRRIAVVLGDKNLWKDAQALLEWALKS